MELGGGNEVGGETSSRRGRRHLEVERGKSRLESSSAEESSRHGVLCVEPLSRVHEKDGVEDGLIRNYEVEAACE